MLLYALQWLVVVLPLVVISARLMAAFLGMDAGEGNLLFQKMLLVVGAVTVIQCRLGHRYPLVDGPSAALLLSVAALAQEGYAAVLGGMLTGAAALVLLGITGLLGKVTGLFADRVVGVVLILIALTFLPHLVPMVTGTSPSHPGGDPFIMLVAIIVTIAIIVISSYARGFLGNLSILAGIVLGYMIMVFAGRVDFAHAASAPLVSLPWPILGPTPRFTTAGTVSFLLANVAVLINGLGSYTASAQVVGGEDVDGRVRRGVSTTGAAGVLAALTGTLGTVSYSQGPGIVLVTRVGSRYPVLVSGLMLCALAFFTRFTAYLITVPEAVVGAALLVTLSTMVGLGVSIIGRQGGKARARENMIVGLPLLLGGSAALLNDPFLSQLPLPVRGIVGNGLIVGIVAVLLLEHVIFKASRIQDPRSKIQDPRSKIQCG
ncbi:MAG: solute carrier family 23 protein [bacterium]|nr:solute carrier family 23 protein [bacterium]